MLIPRISAIREHSIEPDFMSTIKKPLDLMGQGAVILACLGSSLAFGPWPLVDYNSPGPFLYRP